MRVSERIRGLVVTAATEGAKLGSREVAKDLTAPLWHTDLPISATQSSRGSALWGCSRTAPPSRRAIIEDRGRQVAHAGSPGAMTARFALGLYGTVGGLFLRSGYVKPDCRPATRSRRQRIFAPSARIVYRLAC